MLEKSVTALFAATLGAALTLGVAPAQDIGRTDLQPEEKRTISLFQDASPGVVYITIACTPTSSSASRCAIVAGMSSDRSSLNCVGNAGYTPFQSTSSGIPQSQERHPVQSTHLCASHRFSFLIPEAR